MVLDWPIEWVTGRVRARNAKIKEENDMNLELDEEVEAVYRNSTSVGSKSFEQILDILCTMSYLLYCL